MTSYGTPYSRWAGIGPYYAMFPLDFVEGVIQRYTRPGQSILDPFAGRASSVFAAVAVGRPAVGIEINPVGWLYGQAKLHPGDKTTVLTRLDEIAASAHCLPKSAGEELPEFFRHCFGPEPLQFLLAAREHLNWRQDYIDQTLMALILVDLHGVRERSFSNQMRQSRAMEPNYSIKWWQANNLHPPLIDPVAFMRRKVEWRYAKGAPEFNGAHLWLGDSRRQMARVATLVKEKRLPRFSLLLTSPPYIRISDYHRDQWLRLWMLGGEPTYARQTDPHKRDFSSASTFQALLQSVFSQAAPLMRRDGCVYVRTDARETTFEITQQVLRDCFPGWSLRVTRRPYHQHTQTALYGDNTPKPGEKDIVLVKK